MKKTIAALLLTLPGLALATSPSPSAADPQPEPTAAAPSPPSPPTEAPPAPPAKPPPLPQAKAASAQPASAGQWVYTQQYGWLWMPYGDVYTHVPANGEGEPYAYVYYPSYGWTWVAAPWVWGYGTWPYFGVLGPARFWWYARGWRRGPFVGPRFAYRGYGWHFRR